jgi:hypothetical protein
MPSLGRRREVCSGTESDERTVMSELDLLRQHGDLMQSSLSRLVEWMWAEFPDHRWDALPYEVGMAMLEGESAVEAWTDARRRAA